MKKGKKITVILLVIAIVAYIISAIYFLIINPTDSYIVKQGTLSKEDEENGYIIRNEQIVKGENYENGIYAIAAEGKKVAKNESIFRYYSDSEKEIANKMNELSYQIQALLEQQEKGINSADIKAIENQLEEKIKNINTLNNYHEINDNKKDVDNLISKKIKFIGETTENKEIKKLIAERNSYEEKLKNGSEYLKSTISGIVSYRVDGLEEKLSPNNFETITEEYLENLDLKTGQIISVSNESGKVIDNFKCYIAITMNSKEAMSAEVGDEVKLCISNNEENKAKIVKINEESGKRTIIFEINKMTDEMIKYRKVAVDVIWWDASGLKIPSKALIEENGLYYVVRNKAGVQTKLLVKVIKKTDKFAIIKSYDDEELEEIGYDSKEIKNYKKITNYDEIIINL